MAGLYVHIPFCKSRCIYCGFYSTTCLSFAERYVDALCAELEMRRAGDFAAPPRTIYIGGGTPSALPVALLRRLFSAIDCSEAVEVTVECNPDDVTPDYADALSRLPVNRVSMGAQTFDARRLSFLRRRHGAADVSRAVGNLRRAGIGNVSIDLMYGFPGESMADWRGDIDSVLALSPEHISAYCLSYEEGTPLSRLRDEGRVAEAGEETCRQMYYELIDRLAAAGYEHYETSNFARPGRRSVHNSSYWQCVPYLGIGAAAHSFDGTSRQWNVADIAEYAEAIEHGRLPFEREELDAATRYNDAVMLSLRTCEGIDLGRISSVFGREMADYCLRSAAKYISGGLLLREDGRLRLSREGLFVGDMVASDLMKV